MKNILQQIPRPRSRNATKNAGVFRDNKLVIARCLRHIIAKNMVFTNNIQLLDRKDDNNHISGHYYENVGIICISHP